MEALEILKSKRPSDEITVEIIDTPGFSGSECDINRFADHLERMTYIICPRGVENFSIRVYEALKYGRVPVIIDTDMVLPDEIDWDRVSIRIPFNRQNEMYDIIIDDYASRSGPQFVERQQAAFSTMIELETMGWLTKRLEHFLKTMETCELFTSVQ